MIDILLDTNILIYLAKGEERYVRFFEGNWADREYAVSVISAMEGIVGAHDSQERHMLEERLELMMIVPLTEEIGFLAVKHLREGQKKNIRGPEFPDTVIAFTALSLGVPLVTNNPKDFAMFKGLKLVMP